MNFNILVKIDLRYKHIGRISIDVKTWKKKFKKKNELLTVCCDLLVRKEKVKAITCVVFNN